MTHRSGTQLETLLVGIDAACLPVVEPLCEDGELPTIRSIFQSGVSGPLESQIPPWTASAWPSLYTSANHGKHGIFGFLHFDGCDWDVVNATNSRAYPAFEPRDTISTEDETVEKRLSDLGYIGK